jgi:predicted lipoprotein with Yx(FWY)xxD motif
VAGVFTDVLQARTVPKMGKVAADKDGWVLYRFDKDKPGAKTSACTGKCVETWPPLLTDGTPILRGIDGTKVGVIVRDDGGRQLTLGGWPLYRYIGDPKPGNWTGQGVMGTWWVSDPTGKKNLTCVPKGTPTPAALPTYVPPTKKSDPSQTGGAGGGGY